MKRCPYCAEEIHDDAIKCRFCGEWFPKTQESPVGKESIVPDEGQSTKIAVKNLGHVSKKCPRCGILNPGSAQICDCGHEFDTLEEDVPSVAENRERLLDSWELDSKRKISAGWGWFILLGIYLGSFKQVNMKSFSNETATYRFLIELLGIALVLLMYYWLRNRSIRKKQYAKVWHSSFGSGFVSLFFISIFIGLLLGVVRGIDNGAATKHFNATMAELKTLAVQWNQEEEKLWEQLAQAPNTVRGNADSVNLLKKLINLTEKRKAFMDRSFAEFKYFYEDSKNVDALNKIQELKKLTYDGFEAYRKGIESYIEYYSTGDKEKEEVASTLISEVDSIRKKQESLAIEIRKYYPSW